MDYQTLIYVLILSMNNKTLGIIIIVFGGLVLYSDQEYSMLVSAIAIGIGSGIFFWKDKKNDIDTITDIENRK